MNSTLLTLALALAVLAASAGERGFPAREGILNFGRVNDVLYRGAQPDEQAIQNLKRLGVRSIINLCTAKETWKPEAEQARANGLIYTNVPLRGVGRPKDKQVGTILSLVETLPSPIFIHCEHGCDRTGTIVACYRIRHDKWSNTSALAEAEQYGISRFERGMRKYIAGFGTKTDSASTP